MERVWVSSAFQIKAIYVITTFTYLGPPPEKRCLSRHQAYILESKYKLRNLNFIGRNSYPAPPSEVGYYTLLIHPYFITSDNINWKYSHLHKTYNYIKGVPVGIGFMIQIIKSEILQLRSWKILIYILIYIYIYIYRVGRLRWSSG